MKILPIFSAVLLSVALISAPVLGKGESKAAKTAPATLTNAQIIDQSISFDVPTRETVIDEKGQALTMFHYEIRNIGSKPITSIQWISAYVAQQKILYSQNMQINLESPLEPGKSLNLNLKIPFAQIAEANRAPFLNLQEKIEVYQLDRAIKLQGQGEIRER